MSDKPKENIKIRYGGCVSLDLELRRIPFDSALKILKFVAKETGTVFDEPEFIEQEDGNYSAIITADENPNDPEIEGSYPRSVSTEESGMETFFHSDSPHDEK